MDTPYIIRRGSWRATLKKVKSSCILFSFMGVRADWQLWSKWKRLCRILLFMGLRVKDKDRQQCENFPVYARFLERNLSI